MFSKKELRLMFNDPLDQLVMYINLKLLKNKTLRTIFS
ncbi:hypothetical protein PROCH_0165 [Prochlorococcus marinus str. EQPAC1]|nr:hypothetical protein PROCH_0165 [Prochlorococcus marinus str. EQPAC1]